MNRNTTDLATRTYNIHGVTVHSYNVAPGGMVMFVVSEGWSNVHWTDAYTITAEQGAWVMHSAAARDHIAPVL
jgi:hypothetical protein